MPAARAASSREDPSSTSARASIRRAARASRHRAASRRSSPAPGSCRVIAIVIRALPCRRPTTDQPRRAPRGSGRDNTSGIQAVGITPPSTPAGAGSLRGCAPPRGEAVQVAGGRVSLRFLLDENVPVDLGTALSVRGHDVLLLPPHLRSAADHTVLTLAAEQDGV